MYQADPATSKRVVQCKMILNGGKGTVQLTYKDEHGEASVKAVIGGSTESLKTPCRASWGEFLGRGGFWFKIATGWYF